MALRPIMKLGDFEYASVLIEHVADGIHAPKVFSAAHTPEGRSPLLSLLRD